MPNITQIEIVIDDVIKTFEKVVVGKQVLLSESQNTLSSYYVEEKKNVLVSGNKAANLIIAVPLDEDYDFLNEKLYCYFPPQFMLVFLYCVSINKPLQLH